MGPISCEVLKPCKCEKSAGSGKKGLSERERERKTSLLSKASQKEIQTPWRPSSIKLLARQRLRQEEFCRMKRMEDFGRSGGVRRLLLSPYCLSRQQSWEPFHHYFRQRSLKWFIRHKFSSLCPPPPPQSTQVLALPECCPQCRHAFKAFEGAGRKQDCVIVHGKKKEGWGSLARRKIAPFK